MPNWKNNVESFLKLAQILAIVVPACWVLYQYVTFQREANQFSLMQQRLANKQSEYTLQSQQAAEKYTLDQAALAVKQANFTLRTQQAQAKLRERELQYDVDSKRQDITIKKLQHDIDSFNLAAKTTYRVTHRSSIKIRNIEPNLYEVTLFPGVENTSDSSVEVSLIVVDVYIGQLQRGLVAKELPKSVALEAPAIPSKEETYAIPIISPPGRWSARPVDGAIKWKMVAVSGAVYSGALGNFYSYAAGRIAQDELKNETIRMNGPGTGLWKQGETIEFVPKFLVRAQPDDYIGFSVHMCFNRGKNAEDLYWFAAHLRLNESGESTAEKK